MTFLNKMNRILCSWWGGLLAMLAVFTLLRAVFHIFNADLLPGSGNIRATAGVYYWGFRYDLAVLFFASLPVLVLLSVKDLLLPGKSFAMLARGAAASWYGFIIIVGVADIPYFRFNGRRATREVFTLLEDSASAFSSFLLEYAGFVVLSLLLIYFISRVLKRPPASKPRLPWTMALTLLAALLAVNFGHPLTPKNATFHTRPDRAALVTNSPMTLAYSLMKRQVTLEEKHYFDSESERKDRFDIHTVFRADSIFRKRNVVIFVLESFSREYFVDGHPNRAPAPFLDSLMDRSLVFTNAFANGTTSAYGLMSILGGIPPFLDEPYFASIYGDNRLTGVGSLLADFGYSSRFFYGAEDDHYGFRKNMSLLGIDRYHSMEDYKRYAGIDAFQKNYDGNWGIYDGPFFQYAASVMEAESKPFFATIFNISTHFPYMVPPELKAELDAGSLPSHRSIAYTDRSLRQFFDTVRRSDWYEETLFIFIADHWAKMREMQDKSVVGVYRIPFFVFDPADPAGRTSDRVVQQVDAVPLVLDLLDYSGPWMSFGRSPLDSRHYGFTFNEYEDIYRLIDSAYVLGYDENREASFSLHNYRADPNLETDLIGGAPGRAADMEKQLRAVIQAYNNHLLHNDVGLRPLPEP